MNNVINRVQKYKKVTLVFIISLVLAVIVVTLFALYIKNEQQATRTNTIGFESLHPTYASINDLMKDPDLAFAGKVSVADNGKVRSQKASETSEAPPIVHTDYRLDVRSVLFGKDIPQEITLSLSGGKVEGIEFMHENIPELKKGDTVILFALLGDDSKYYALAGGTAIATQKDSSHFTLSEGTINTGATTFTERDVKK